jgi:NAD+ kinase
VNFDLVAHLARPGAVELVRSAVTLLEADGHRCRLRIPEGVGSADAPADLSHLVVPMPDEDATAVRDGGDLVVSFGGDGTFLRAARLARATDAPVVGVNIGRLGFLAEIEPEDLEAGLRVLSSGSHRIEERSTLHVVVEAADGRRISEGWALNDVAVEKEARQRLVRLEVSIGPTHFASMAADGVIVATSTGSTAYALSAGGPIVNPSLHTMLIAPVAPHSLFDRTVVTDLSDTIVIDVAGEQDGALVSTDGMDPVVVAPGGRVLVSGGARPVRFARVGDGEFFSRVRRTFRLG